jgi:carbonic anhydrase
LVAVLTCIDGRVPVDAAFDQGPGEICVIRSGAHVLDRAVLGSVALAVTTLRVGAVLVLGHTDCVAVMAATTAVRAGRDPVGAAGYVLEQIAPAVRDVGGTAPALEVVRAHVRRTVAHLRTCHGVIRRRWPVASTIWTPVGSRCWTEPGQLSKTPASTSRFSVVSQP